MKGVVKWFRRDKGYGFIQSSEGDDIFVHWQEVEKSGLHSLDEGQRVEFQVCENSKGKFAVNLVNLWPV